jgi:mono/diheme cytochrome c family protein
VGMWLVLAPAAVLAAEPEPPAAPEPPIDPIFSDAPADLEVPVPASPVPNAEREAVRALTNPVAGDPSALSKGGLLFAAHCTVCHGSASEGPPADSGFTPPPRDFRSAAFHAVRSDGELFWAIKNGVDGTAMLPWEGRLSDREIWMLVAYIRTRIGTPP